MGLISKLIKAAIGALLADKAARSAALATIVRYIGYIFRPKEASKAASSISGLGRRAAGHTPYDLLSKLLHAAAELLILRFFARKGGLFAAAVLSGLSAILLASRRSGKDGSLSAKESESRRIIDLDDYTVLDDRR